MLTGSQAFFGQNALRAVTDAPFDFFLRYNAPTPIDIGTDDYLRIASRALNTVAGRLAAARRRSSSIEDADRRAHDADVAAPIKLPTDGVTWVDFRAPLSGGLGWTRHGTANLHAVRAIEMHTDTWDAGFTWDIDAVMFTKQFDTCAGTPASISASATARATTATVTYTAVAGAVGYNIYRDRERRGAVFLTRARTTTFEDSGLALNTTYALHGAAVHVVELRERRRADDGHHPDERQRRQPRSNAEGAAAVLHRHAPTPTRPREINQMKAGDRALPAVVLPQQLGAAEPDARLPDDRRGGAEHRRAATMANIEADLRARGIIDNQYEGVFPIARTWRAAWADSCCSGETVGAFANGCGVPFPSNDPA